MVGGGTDLVDDAPALEPSPGEYSSALPLSATSSATRANLSAMLARWMEVDLTRRLAFLALSAVYLLSRVPFIDNGYGTKPDAWRIALSGYWLWEHGSFYPSRLPGYPIPELANAAVFKGGWLATNSLTMLVSLLGLWFFARIVRLVEIPTRRW